MTPPLKIVNWYWIPCWFYDFMGQRTLKSQGKQQIICFFFFFKSYMLSCSAPLVKHTFDSGKSVSTTKQRRVIPDENFARRPGLVTKSHWPSFPELSNNLGTNNKWYTFRAWSQTQLLLHVIIKLLMKHKFKANFFFWLWLRKMSFATNKIKFPQQKSSFGIFEWIKFPQTHQK